MILFSIAQGSFNHPFHMHGHDVWVLKMGSAEEKLQPNFWQNVQKKQKPTKRDTVILEAGGYLVMRTIYDNPGKITDVAS